MYPNVHRPMATVAKLWKEPKCPSTDEWIKKMWSIYTREYSSAIRKDEYPPFPSTWMEQERIMLNEISQAEKNNNYMVSLICGTRNRGGPQGKGGKTEWEEIREGDKP